MQLSKMLLSCILGVVVCGGASAQIYESKDAQGTPVFSDKPSHGAEEIELPPTNSADPVAERPRPEPDAAIHTAPQNSFGFGKDDLQEQGSQYDHDDEPYYYGGTYNNNNDAADTRNERREQRRNDSQRPKTDRPYVDHRGDSSRPAPGIRGR